ncbi:MAG: hypothetical protein KJ906_01835 [Nanoarchaeota archaeon]|nr:hypothetical protein [Nanoarchaeota archaeon]
MSYPNATEQEEFDFINYMTIASSHCFAKYLPREVSCKVPVDECDPSSCNRMKVYRSRD